ncbi:hemolysin-III related-domain-containing protein [Podospora fimiseda]|uniref:Hemolysin-III related-domain-containing protein n=1 Tax=Podospora fimiseda TaxID=252190 RepID=A0AAN7BUE9_9PEZI|nr:hemolysin-III related-domain-containing protein [Podospora fimiseda]
MSTVTRLRASRPQHPKVPKRQPEESTSDTTLKSGRPGRPSLLSFSEMPEWFQHEANQWILDGYRPISGSAQVSFRSWSYLHNESVNIYSHLIPGVGFLLGEWYLQQYLTSRYPEATFADFIAFSVFILTAVLCMSFSATYHTMLNHSQKMENLFLRLDMLGILLFIIGDLVLGMYVVFWCEPLPRNIYWAMVAVLGTLTVFMTMYPKFQGAKYRLFRALIFVATGLFGLVPLIHGIYTFGISQMMNKALPYTAAKAGFLLSGTLFYATRFPESRYPGKFDFWGSHSIFHVLVVCSALVQLVGYFDALGYAHAKLTCSTR